MRPITDNTLDTFEEVALEGAKRLMAYFAYEGDNPQYRDKARAGATAISAYARMRASESNRMAVEVMVGRLAEVQKLKGGK